MQKTLQDLHISHERNEYENIRYLLKKEGMPSGASPSLDAWVSLNIYLGFLGNPQVLALASPSSPHIETSSIFEHFIHTKLNKKLGKIR